MDYYSLRAYNTNNSIEKTGSEARQGGQGGQRDEKDPPTHTQRTAYAKRSKCICQIEYGVP